MNKTEAENTQAAQTDVRKVRQQQGLVILLIGVAGFIPAMAVTVFSAEHRIAGAMAVLVCWGIVKIGKTIMRSNALKE